MVGKRRENSKGRQGWSLAPKKWKEQQEKYNSVHSLLTRSKRSCFEWNGATLGAYLSLPFLLFLCFPFLEKCSEAETNSDKEEAEVKTVKNWWWNDSLTNLHPRGTRRGKQMYETKRKKWINHQKSASKTEKRWSEWRIQWRQKKMLFLLLQKLLAVSFLGFSGFFVCR